MDVGWVETEEEKMAEAAVDMAAEVGVVDVRAEGTKEVVVDSEAAAA